MLLKEKQARQEAKRIKKIALMHKHIMHRKWSYVYKPGTILAARVCIDIFDDLLLFSYQPYRRKILDGYCRPFEDEYLEDIIREPYTDPKFD